MLYIMIMCVCTYKGQRSSVKSHNTTSSPNKTGSARKIAALRQKLHGEKVRRLLRDAIPTFTPLNVVMNNTMFHFQAVRDFGEHVVLAYI